MTWRAAIVALSVAVCSLSSGCTPEEAVRGAFALRGATVAQQDDAVRVASCESGLQADPGNHGAGNWGVLQINWTAQHVRVERLGLTKADLLNPWWNAVVAADLWVDLGHRFGTSRGWSCARIVGVR